MQLTILTLAALTTLSTSMPHPGVPSVTINSYKDNYTTVYETFTRALDSIELGPFYPTIKLEIIGANRVPYESITCRAYKDQRAQEPGSAYFTAAEPALIATPGNAVSEGSVLCHSSEIPTNE